MNESNRQVIIYLDDPEGQVIQTSMASYREYWQRLGWSILGRAPELALAVEPSGDSQAILL